MASAATPSRRFKLFGYSKKIQPITHARNIQYSLCKLAGRLNREYDPDRDDELRVLRQGSNISDFDNIEFRIRQEKIDLTYVHDNVDVEMPTAAEIRRMPGPVRRNLRFFPQIPPGEAYRGPPTPAIPDPYDDSKLEGLRDKYMLRSKIDPDETKGKKKKKSTDENKKRKRKARGRNQSEHPEEADIEIGHGRKRCRLYEEEQAQTGEQHVQDCNPVHLSLTSATTAGFTASCDMPVQSIEQADGQVEANLSFLEQFNNARSVLIAPEETSATTSTSLSSITSPPARSRAAPSTSSSSGPSPAVGAQRRRGRGTLLRGAGGPAPSSAPAPSSPGPREPAVEAAAPSTPVATEDPDAPQFAKQGFLALPREVRLGIYQHLLVRAEPIRVHAS